MHRFVLPPPAPPRPARPSQVARLFSGNQPVKKGIAPIRRKSEGADKGDQLVVHALRLVESTDRFSSDMRALEKGAGAGMIRAGKRGQEWGPGARAGAGVERGPCRATMLQQYGELPGLMVKGTDSKQAQAANSACSKKYWQQAVQAASSRDGKQ